MKLRCSSKVSPWIRAASRNTAAFSVRGFRCPTELMLRSELTLGRDCRMPLARESEVVDVVESRKSAVQGFHVVDARFQVLNDVSHLAFH